MEARWELDGKALRRASMGNPIEHKLLQSRYATHSITFLLFRSRVNRTLRKYCQAWALLTRPFFQRISGVLLFFLFFYYISLPVPPGLVVDWGAPPGTGNGRGGPNVVAFHTLTAMYTDRHTVERGRGDASDRLPVDRQAAAVPRRSIGSTTVRHRARSIREHTVTALASGACDTTQRMKGAKAHGHQSLRQRQNPTRTLHPIGYLSPPPVEIPSNVSA